MWCILRRIPRSKIALNKSQFDAIHIHISRSLCGTGKQVSGIVETHSECAEQVMPRSCVSEAGVAGVSSPVMTRSCVAEAAVAGVSSPVMQRSCVSEVGVAGVSSPVMQRSCVSEVGIAGVSFPVMMRSCVAEAGVAGVSSPVMQRSCVSEAGVAGVSSPVQTCPATTDTNTHSGVHCYILISLRYCPNCCIMRVLP